MNSKQIANSKKVQVLSLRLTEANISLKNFNDNCSRFDFQQAIVIAIFV